MNAEGKSILIIYTPTECIECPFCRVNADDKLTETHCTWMALTNEDGVNTRAEWCPLKPLPKKKNTDFHPNVVYANGWNDCLEELEK